MSELSKLFIDARQRNHSKGCMHFFSWLYAPLASIRRRFLPQLDEVDLQFSIKRYQWCGDPVTWRSGCQQASTASTMALRWASIADPALLLSLRAMRLLVSASLGIGPRFGGPR